MADSGASSEAGSSTLGNPICPARPAARAAAAGRRALLLRWRSSRATASRSASMRGRRSALSCTFEAKLSDEQRVTMDKLLEQLDQQASVVITNPLAKGALRPAAPKLRWLRAPSPPSIPGRRRPPRGPARAAGGGRGRDAKRRPPLVPGGHPAADGCPPQAAARPPRRVRRLPAPLPALCAPPPGRAAAARARRPPIAAARSPCLIAAPARPRLQTTRSCT